MKKILYCLLAIIFIASIIVTCILGVKVGFYYRSGEEIIFNVGKDINKEDIKTIGEEVFEGQEILVSKVELFNDSASIKVNSASDEQLENLATKLNEKYGCKLESSSFLVQDIKNVRAHTLIQPYIAPIGLATLIILAYYAVRFKGAGPMYKLLKCLIIFGILLFAAYALCRIPVGVYTVPTALLLYGLIITIYTARAEFVNE